MIVTYDILAEAFYFQLKSEAKIARTVEVDVNTYLDLDEHGSLIGVEVLHPDPSQLRRVAQKHCVPELSKIDLIRRSYRKS
jgi:uncharacterized protein YuzE